MEIAAKMAFGNRPNKEEVMIDRAILICVLYILGGMAILCFLMAAIGNFTEKINVAPWFLAGCAIVFILLITMNFLGIDIFPIKF